jgi:hypothetical protein
MAQSWGPLSVLRWDSKREQRLWDPPWARPWEQGLDPGWGLPLVLHWGRPSGQNLGSQWDLPSGPKSADCSDTALARLSARRREHRWGLESAPRSVFS